MLEKLTCRVLRDLLEQGQVAKVAKKAPVFAVDQFIGDLTEFILVVLE